jgi:hypothetical protein
MAKSRLSVHTVCEKMHRDFVSILFVIIGKGVVNDAKTCDA